jgi:NAD(P)-dependent dehydrogenase (short-subunit alcohol dehydrogenase family)/rhamnose utilization protein RhaD (predicted bifunctional aldolase and dehydrogenase)
MKQLEQLVELSRRYGADPDMVIAGGGNTSFKTSDRLWVKASGRPLATITAEGFAEMDRALLAPMGNKTYSADPATREEEVKRDLAAANLTPCRRPSVETSMHDAITWPFVVHLHPTLVSALMSSQRAEELTREIFGPRALYITYADPGYVLFKKVDDGIAAYKEAHGVEPHIIMLQNHGIFVGGDTPEDISRIYDEVLAAIAARITEPLPSGHRAVGERACEVLPALRMMLGGKTLRTTNSPLVEYFAESPDRFRDASRPFTPDGTVYCGAHFIHSPDPTPETLALQIEDFRARWGRDPKVMMIRGVGLVACGDSAASAQTITDVYTDSLAIAWLTRSMGGPHPMTEEQVEFIDNWEVENYRRSISSGTHGGGRMEGKTVIITGAAQGFGEGIARCLAIEGANIVVADLNDEAGRATVEKLNSVAVKNNRVIFVKTDVANPATISSLIRETVIAFGGLDLFVSNAGVLRAGGLDDMTPEAFDFVTRINYNAYFYCVQAAAPVMKLQNAWAPDNWGDIVQINSKSGLRGSRANFAYAGGKFGGVGLTQSFALELAPFRIKVNCVCPGNFYEGPLWSDPVNGLFVQYLAAGKVPGAETIEDVRRHYMSQVPMGKGTSPEDVTRAILYLVEQTCETGQALPVTGGQVMLN